MQSRPGHPQNFKLISKSSYMRPVFPDYLSVSYDYVVIEQDWAKASPSTFSWLYIVVCAVVKKYREMFS